MLDAAWRMATEEGEGAIHRGAAQALDDDVSDPTGDAPAGFRRTVWGHPHESDGAPAPRPVVQSSYRLFPR